MTPDELKELEVECTDLSGDAILLTNGLDETASVKLKTSLRAKNFRVETLDGENIRNKAELLEALDNACGFPGFYGKNWDALNDCLSNPASWDRPVSEAEAGIILIYHDATTLKQSDREAFVTFTEIVISVQKGWRTEGRNFRFCVLLGA